MIWVLVMSDLNFKKVYYKYQILFLLTLFHLKKYIYGFLHFLLCYVFNFYVKRHLSFKLLLYFLCKPTCQSI